MKRVAIVGRGKVGTALCTAARGGGLDVRLLSGRAVTAGARVPRVDLVVVAVRDPDVGAVAKALARRPKNVGAAIHCAGALGPAALESLAAVGIPTAAAHPLLSFSGSARTALAGGALVVEGDPRAVQAARVFADHLGMRPVVVEGLDRSRYHAAAALAANGAVALASTAADLLVAAGVDPTRTAMLLGPLLRSVGENVLNLGPRRALSGPVRRGDAATIQRHLTVLAADGGESLAAFYRMLVQVQIEIARGLSDRDEAGNADRDYTQLEALTRP